MYVTVFNSSATWAATFHLQGYKCMLVIFVSIIHQILDMDYRIFNVLHGLRMHAYTHAGVGHTDNESTQTF